MSLGQKFFFCLMVLWVQGLEVVCSWLEAPLQSGVLDCVFAEIHSKAEPNQLSTRPSHTIGSARPCAHADPKP